MKTMKPLKILSIDWDYFINATEIQRLMLFPDAHEDLGIKLNTCIWTTHYTPGNKLLDISVSKEYDLMKTYLETAFLSTQPRVTITDSHRILYDLFQAYSAQSSIELIHIDHHSDLYNIGEGVNCGNWLNHLLGEFKNLKVTWVHNADSEINSSTMSKYKQVTETSKSLSQVLSQYVPDVLFLCKSSCWSPPHLDSYFDAIVDILKSSGAYTVYSNDINNRYTTEFRADIEQYNSFMINNFPK